VVPCLFVKLATVVLKQAILVCAVFLNFFLSFLLLFIVGLDYISPVMVFLTN